jgi:hypothetical protein
MNPLPSPLDPLGEEEREPPEYDLPDLSLSKAWPVHISHSAPQEFWSKGEPGSFLGA